MCSDPGAVGHAPDMPEEENREAKKEIRKARKLEALKKKVRAEASRAKNFLAELGSAAAGAEYNGKLYERYRGVGIEQATMGTTTWFLGIGCTGYATMKKNLSLCQRAIDDMMHELEDKINAGDEIGGGGRSSELLLLGQVAMPSMSSSSRRHLGWGAVE